MDEQNRKDRVEDLPIAREPKRPPNNDAGDRSGAGVPSHERQRTRDGETGGEPEGPGTGTFGDSGV